MRWTESETQILRDQSATYDELLLLLPHRTKMSIIRKCWESNLPREESKFVQKLRASSKLQDALTGHLLGDGHIDKKYAFAVTTIHKEYANWCQSILNEVSGVDWNIYTRKPTERKGRFCKISYRAHMSCSKFLREWRQLWYPSGVKIVPESVVLNRDVIRRWYVEDGCLYKGCRSAQITFCTDSFPEDGVLLLQKQMAELGFLTGLKCIKKTYLRLTIYGKKNCRKFLDFLGEPPVAKFAYKWELQ